MEDQDKIEKVIAEELPMKVAGDKAYQNARANSDRQNARIEHDKALERAMTELLADHTELFKQFSDNDSFRRWLSETVFAATYEEERLACAPGFQERLEVPRDELNRRHEDFQSSALPTELPRHGMGVILTAPAWGVPETENRKRRAA